MYAVAVVVGCSAIKRVTCDPGASPGSSVEAFLEQVPISQSSPARRYSDSRDDVSPPADGTAARARALSTGPPRMTPLRELQLVETYRQGGADAADALGELLQAYQRRIYSICYRMLHHQEDASDLTQEALVKIIEGLDSYDGRSKLSTWAIRVAMNCCLSHLRKQKFRDHESLDAHASARTAFSRNSGGIGMQSGRGIRGLRPEPLPHESVEQAQTRAMVLRALESLEPDVRALLVLRDLQGLDYEQLAEVLDVPIGTVKSRLFRARAALRSALEAQGCA